MWQEAAIVLIGFIVILYLAWKFYKNITGPSRGHSPCDGCKGCGIKNIKRHNM